MPGTYTWPCVVRGKNVFSPICMIPKRPPLSMQRLRARASRKSAVWEGLARVCRRRQSGESGRVDLFLLVGGADAGSCIFATMVKYAKEPTNGSKSCKVSQQPSLDPLRWSTAREAPLPQ